MLLDLVALSLRDDVRYFVDETGFHYTALRITNILFSNVCGHKRPLNAISLPLVVYICIFAAYVNNMTLLKVITRLKLIDVSGFCLRSFLI